jgi:hypothetical protein
MKRIIEDIKSFKGNTVCIGVEDSKIKNTLKKNKDISIYELNRASTRKLFSRRKRLKASGGISVKIKKFRKLFKKKSIEYVIIDLNNMYDYYKYMASNSIYICNKKIYIYGNSDYVTAKGVAKKFKRYKTNIETIQIDNDYLVIVECKNAKYSKIKEKFYLIIDTFHNLGDMISYFLTS